MGESRTNEGGQDRRRSRNDCEWQLASDAFTNQSRTWIRDSGRSGVGNKGDVFACPESLHELRGAHGFIVLVITDERFLDFEPL